MIDIRSLLEQALQQFKVKNQETKLEAELLLCHVLTKTGPIFLPIRMPWFLLNR